MKRQFEMFNCELAPDIINGHSRSDREKIAIIGYPSHRKDGFLFIHLATGVSVKLPVLDVTIRPLRKRILNSEQGFDLWEKGCEWDCEVREIHMPRWLCIDAELEEFMI